MCFPDSTVFDRSGNLWEADVGNSRVLEFRAPFSTGEAASVVLGQSGFTTNACATTNNGLCWPDALAFDASGNLWVADVLNSRVLEFKAPLSSGEAASVVLGQPGFTTNACEITNTGLCGPEGLAFDRWGNLWVSDNTSSRILEFKAPFSTGEAASIVLGSPRAETSGCATTTKSSLCGNVGIAFDPSGNLWVADFFNYRVLEFRAPFSNYENASLVIGQPGFTTNACGAGKRGLCGPQGLTFDRWGNLWVGDAGDYPPGGVGNSRVLEFKAPFSNGEAASLVLGQPGFGAITCKTTRTGECGPTGVTFDIWGNLWVSDSFNNRVLEYTWS